MDDGEDVLIIVTDKIENGLRDYRELKNTIHSLDDIEYINSHAKKNKVIKYKYLLDAFRALHKSGKVGRPVGFVI